MCFSQPLHTACTPVNQYLPHHTISTLLAFKREVYTCLTYTTPLLIKNFDLAGGPRMGPQTEIWHAHLNQIRLNQTSEHYSHTFCAPECRPDMPWPLNQIRLNQTSEHYSHTFCAPELRPIAVSWFTNSCRALPPKDKGKCEGIPKHPQSMLRPRISLGWDFQFQFSNFLSMFRLQPSSCDCCWFGLGVVGFASARRIDGHSPGDNPESRSQFVCCCSGNLPSSQNIRERPQTISSNLLHTAPQVGGRRKSIVLGKRPIGPKPQTLWFRPLWPGPSKIKVF
jgi:hypothetical protein